MGMFDYPLSGGCNALSPRLEEVASEMPRKQTERNTELAQEVGGRIRATRMRRKLTQEQLAFRAGTTFATLSRVENGHATPTLETLERFADVLGVRMRDLLPADQDGHRQAGNRWFQNKADEQGEVRREGPNPNGNRSHKRASKTRKVAA